MGARRELACAGARRLEAADLEADWALGMAGGVRRDERTSCEGQKSISEGETMGSGPRASLREDTTALGTWDPAQRTARTDISARASRGLGTVPILVGGR